jgi:2-iminobutanoate/2-iminopropanoate deaminase
VTKIINPVPAGSFVAEGWLSAAVRVDNLVFLAGVIGCDPNTGEVIRDTEAQIRGSFEQIKMILNAHGSDLPHVVRMTMYFTDRKRQWPILDRVRREVFPIDPPASTGVGVTELAWGAEVEIDVIAIVPD